jgi:SAM-dependent methyltransferase
VRAAGARPVADLGCGPGRVTAHLHALGLNAFGVDLSPQMVAVARRTHPGLRFDEGSMLALDISDGALGDIVAMYSIIHIPQEQLPEVFAELLSKAGMVLRARLLREPDEGGVETTRQAYLLARKPADVSRP